MESAGEFKPRVVGFLCNWCCYAGADLAGVSRYQYPPNIRIIRLMCSGRVEPAFIFRAFARGGDGVFIGGCWPGECHYLTEGNYDALCLTKVVRKMLEQIGLKAERLRLEWVSASEGIRFAEVMNDFIGKLQGFGPLGRGEGLAEGELKKRLQAALALAPFVRLALAERLRVPVRQPQMAEEYLASEQFDRLYREVIGRRLQEMLSPPQDTGVLSGEQLAQVDRVIAAHNGRAEMAIMILMELQGLFGWLPAQVLQRASERLSVPLSRLRQIASFYKTFSLSPPQSRAGATAPAEEVLDIYR